MNGLALRPSALLALTTLLGALALGAPARAQNKAIEGQARGLQKKAMQEDYLATDFDKAQEKLNQAIAKCGADKCAAALRAELRRDLGVVLIGGQIDKDKGVASWVDALKIDPTLQLDPDVKTKELEKLFEEARQKIGGSAPAAGAAKPSAAAEVPAGDFAHSPVAEQAVRTPVPVYAEYTGSEPVVKVVVKYKGFGMPDWKVMELPHAGKGYGGLLPCGDMQQGEVLYYLQGFNAQNDPVATSGDRNNPFRVPIKAKLDAEPPHLPGQAPPKQCQEAASDCPPDFPGCKRAGATAPAASEETSTDDLRKGEGESCDEDSECRSNQCKAGVCAAEKKKFKRLWIGVAGSVDLVFLSSASNVCKLDPKQATPFGDSGYYCTNGDVDFPSRADNGAENNTVALNNLNTISGGTALGNVRVMLSLDYAISPNFLVGGRVGYVAGTYTGQAAKDEGKTFAPVHLEARATYLIGKDAITRPFAPYTFLGVGATELDAKLDVNVVVSSQKRTMAAWAIGGPGFIAPGGGVRFAFGPRAALMVAPVRFTFAVGPNGFLPAWSPELGFHFGL